MLLNPAFFDILGIGAFAFVTAFALWLLTTRGLPTRITLYILLSVGIAGLIIDAVIVYQTYLK